MCCEIAEESRTKRVGIRECCDQATRYLAGDEVLAIERHGQLIGFYVPVRASRQGGFAQALDGLQQSTQRVLGETGMFEVSRPYFLSQSAPDGTRPPQ